MNPTGLSEVSRMPKLMRREKRVGHMSTATVEWDLEAFPSLCDPEDKTDVEM